MFAYYLKLAARSLRATPTQTAITMLAMGLGIAVPTAMLSVHHVFAQNPIPGKSDVLYNVRVDSWDPSSEFYDIRPGDPPKHVTYRDMTGLAASDLPLHHTGVASAVIYVFPESTNLPPYQAILQLCHADFFPMFDVPFKYGAGWSRQVDQSLDHVVVLSEATNEKLFGGANSVGKTVRLGQQQFTVVGVLAPFRPMPQYYDVINNAYGLPRDFFLPFDLIRDQGLGLVRVGDSDNWGNGDFSQDPDSFFTASEATWIQYWVELPPERLAAYRDFVDAYTKEQKAAGRFPRPINNRVTPLMEWLRVRNVVPPAASAMVVISLLFLAVCCLNLVGLLLSRFFAKSTQLGVHRALGASRRAIFVQRLLECELVGLLGGLVGLLLAAIALFLLDHALPRMIVPAGTFHVDRYALATALVLSLVAGLLSGLYPAWRACRIAPAQQLKLG
jgi:putative ABC transport system permease protein